MKSAIKLFIPRGGIKMARMGNFAGVVRFFSGMEVKKVRVKKPETLNTLCGGDWRKLVLGEELDESTKKLVGEGYEPLTMECMIDFIRAKGGERIAVVDVRGKMTQADYLIIVENGENVDLHMLATNVRLLLKRHHRKIGKKISDTNWKINNNHDGWIVLCVFNLHINFMEPEVRDKYRPERMWMLIDHLDTLLKPRPKESHE